MADAARKVRRGAAAFFLSMIFPGLGHVYNGQLLAALLIAVAFLALQYVAGLFGALHTFRTAVAYVIVNWSVQVSVAVWASVVAVRQLNVNVFPQRRRRIAMGVCVLVVGVGALAVLGFPEKILGVRGFVGHGQSMSPTVIEGDRFVVDVRSYRKRQPARGDVIAFRMPHGDGLSIKRLMAMAGDTIAGGPGWLMVNGKLLSEPYLHKDVEPTDDPTFGPVRLSSNQLFVMGDNRGQSYDSRSYGPIDARAVVGKALYVYYSSADRGRVGREIR